MSIIKKLGWIAGTFIVGSIIAILAIVFTAACELTRMIKYGWFKLAVRIAHWAKINSRYVIDMTDFVTQVADYDADKAAKFREWEFTQWKKS